MQMNSDVYDDVDMALRKQAFICRNRCAFVAMERDLVPMSLTQCGGLLFGRTVLMKCPPPVVPPQEAFMKHAEASYHVPGQFSMNM